MRRVETDDDAVHITTVHSAKGLEYPDRARARSPTPSARRRAGPTCSTTTDGRVVDVASWVAWGDGVDEGGKEALDAAAERKRLATVEVDGDSLRLLYVALTRAKHHLEIWWAPTRGAGTSALGRLLLDRWGAGPVFNSPLGDAYETRRRGRREQADRCPRGRVERHDRPLRRPAASSRCARRCRCSRAAGEPARRRRLRGPPPAGRSGAADVVVHGDHRRARRRRRTRRPSRTVAGGYDELPDGRRAEPSRGPTRASRSMQPPPRSCRSAAHRAAPRSASPSTRCSSGSTSRRRRSADDVAERVAAASRRSGLMLDVPATTAGLMAVDRHAARRAVRRSPARATFAPTDRLAELTFDLTFGPTRVAAADIGAVLSTTLDRRRPAARVRPRSWPRRWRSPSWPGGSPARSTPCSASAPPTTRFVVVDYKSNRLHRPRRRRSARRLPARSARRGDDPQPLPAAGGAVLRRPPPLPALAARIRLRPRTPPRWGRLPVRARHDRRRRRRRSTASRTACSRGSPPAATVLALDALFRAGVAADAHRARTSCVASSLCSRGSTPACSEPTEVHAAAVIAELRRAGPPAPTTSCSPSPSPCGRRSTATRASTSTRSPPSSPPSWRSPPPTLTRQRRRRVGTVAVADH